jgi:hypothetical protein
MQLPAWRIDLQQQIQEIQDQRAAVAAARGHANSKHWGYAPHVQQSHQTAPAASPWDYIVQVQQQPQNTAYASSPFLQPALTQQVQQGQQPQRTSQAYYGQTWSYPQQGWSGGWYFGPG